MIRRAIQNMMCLNPFCNFFRGDHRCKSFYRIFLPVNQELCEIPLDGTSHHPAQLVFEVNIKEMCMSAIHINFGEHGKTDAVIDQAPF